MFAPSHPFSPSVGINLHNFMRVIAVIVLSLGFCVSSFANQTTRQLQQTKAVNSLPAQAKRWALIIGVDKYRDSQISPLKGSDNDARTLADALVKHAGFPTDQVILLSTDQPQERQPTRVNILRRLSNLGSVVPKDGLLLVSFAGHGMERNGQAYLLPTDAQISDDITFLEETAVSVQRMKERIKATKVAQVIVMLDACRNDPGGRADAPNSLSQAYVKGFNFDLRNREVEAFATLYATAVGQRAYEYSEKRQGYFTWAIVEGLKGAATNEKGEVTLASLINYVQNTVPKRIGIDLGGSKNQRPFAVVEGYRAEELVLAIGGHAPPSTSDTKSVASDANSMELAFWDSIKSSNDPADFEAYLERFPAGNFAALARARAKRASSPASLQPTSGSANPDLNVDEVIAQAERDFQDKDYEKAFKAMMPVLANNPNHPKANALMGRSYLLGRKYSNASNYLTKALILGEIVDIPIQHHHYVFLKGDDLCKGYLRFHKGGVEFHSVSAGGHDFAVAPSRVYEMFVEAPHGGRLHFKVGLQKDNKEERKTYNFHLPRAIVGTKPGSSVTVVSCDNCSSDLQVMRELLQKLLTAISPNATGTLTETNNLVANAPLSTTTVSSNTAEAVSSESLQAELLAIETKSIEALNNADKSAIAAMMADEFIQVTNGKTYNKQQLLSMVKRQNYQLSVSYEQLSTTTEGLQATLKGIGVLRVTGPNGMVTIRQEFTDVFVKRDGRWLALSSHVKTLK